MTEIRMVIVGSMEKAWPPRNASLAKALIRDVISDRIRKAQADGDILIIGSGESPSGGVDIWVHEIADEFGVTFKAFPPVICEHEECVQVIGPSAGTPGTIRQVKCVDRFHHMYQPRDKAMADWCTELVRVASQHSLTYGSGWTRDEARRQKKPTLEHKI